MTNTSFDKVQLEKTITDIGTQFPGSTVKLGVNGWGHTIALDGEAGIFFHYDSRGHRFNISGCWPRSRTPGADSRASFTPRDLNHQAPDTSINVSAGKGAKQIASDINRRFLPAYREVFARCLERRQQSEDYAAKQNELAGKVARALNVSLKQGDRAKNFDLPSNLTEGSAYGSIEVSGDSVRFEVRSLDADRALKLIEFLKSL